MSYTKEIIVFRNLNPLISSSFRGEIPIMKLKAGEEIKVKFIRPETKTFGQKIAEGFVFEYNNELVWVNAYAQLKNQIKWNNIQPLSKVILSYYGDMPHPTKKGYVIGKWKISYEEDFIAYQRYLESKKETKYDDPTEKIIPSKRVEYTPKPVEKPEITPLPIKKIHPHLKKYYLLGTEIKDNPPYNTKYLRIYHFSHIDRNNLNVDPKYFGHHTYSKASMRISSVKRSYFYTNPVDREWQLGHNLYYGDVLKTSLYDANKDPENLLETLTPHEILYKKSKTHFGIIWYASHLKGQIVNLFKPVLLKRYVY